MKFLQVAVLWSIFALVIAPGATGQVHEAPTATATDTETLPPSAFARPQRPQKPIPLGWKIAIVATALVVASALLTVAARAWRSSNLFDRQYRFPPVSEPALRLGAKKSGGCMATIHFHAADSVSEDSQESHFDR
jgi:hypothetical protein